MKKGFTYICESCGRNFEIKKDLMLCPFCADQNPEGKPLKGVLTVQLPEKFFRSKKNNQEFDVFDYLPVEKKYFSKLNVGDTPLIEPEIIQSELGFNNLFLKFDGTNPTGSFKDRASYLVSAFAKKNKINEIVVASTGNAASSMAGIAAAAGQKAYIFMPQNAPKAKLIQCLQYGATLIPIKGDYDKAFDLSLQFSANTGFLNRNTAYNPMTIEGKKTVSFELVKQMSKKKINLIFLPVGDGVVLSGVIKGFLDLKYLGLINEIPKIIGVQAERSSFLYHAFYNNKFEFDYKAETIADSISVNIARNAYTAIHHLKKVNGKLILVSDHEILEAQNYLSQKSGIFCEPSSAASFAGFMKMKKKVIKEAGVIILLTGHGLKDIETASKIVNFPKAFEPNINIILNKLNI